MIFICSFNRPFNINKALCSETRVLWNIFVYASDNKKMLFIIYFRNNFLSDWIFGTENFFS